MSNAQSDTQSVSIQDDEKNCLFSLYDTVMFVYMIIYVCASI